MEIVVGVTIQLYTYVYLSINLPTHLPIDLPAFLSVDQPVNISVFLHVLLPLYVLRACDAGHQDLLPGLLRAWRRAPGPGRSCV